MTRIQLGVLSGLCCIVLASAACAGELRVPQQGFPAFTVRVPDEWLVQNDNQGDLNLIARDRSSIVSLFPIHDYDGSLDDMANVMFRTMNAAVPARRLDVTLSGHKGYAYETTASMRFSTITSDTDETVYITLVIVPLSDNSVFRYVCTNKSNIADAQASATQTVIDSIALLAPP